MENTNPKLKALKKEFEKKLGKLTLLEDKTESYYTVVNPSALWRFITKAFEAGKKAEREENIKLSDKIEMGSQTSLEEWKAFKRFRNTLRDKQTQQKKEEVIKK